GGGQSYGGGAPRAAAPAAAPAPRQAPPQAPAATGFDDMDDDIPF
ncbi:MAG: single-stranded DNA-binding protein, partial [Burkholderiaceae bacterium]